MTLDVIVFIHVVCEHIYFDNPDITGYFFIKKNNL